MSIRVTHSKRDSTLPGYTSSTRLTRLLHDVPVLAFALAFSCNRLRQPRTIVTLGMLSLLLEQISAVLAEGR